MSTDALRAERLKKINAMREVGIDPYPAESNRTHENSEFVASFSEHELSGTAITLAGRVMSLRGQGGILFADLFDGSARVQTVIKKDDLGEAGFNAFTESVSISDFLEVSGTAFTTQRGAQSLLATSWRMLTKSIRQVPDEWFGLKDEDERLRKRYLDMLLNPEVFALVQQRSKFWNSARTFLLNRGFFEVETPILEIQTGGAEARPFITHHNALDIDAYLRISHELWHKKLIIAGVPKVFEIGRIFRNEGISPEHAQDYTHFEFYQAYQDARAGVPMLIDLYRTMAQETFSTQQFSINGFDVDLAAEWQQVDYTTLMQEAYGFDPRTVDVDTVRERLASSGVAAEADIELGRGVDMLWKRIRKTIGGPAILTGIPVYLEPLAKKNVHDPRTVDRFQILIGGSEVGKAFNELNDPIDQRERFDQQQALRDGGDDEAQMADYDYVEALEYGMPPTFGFGVSERLFSFLAGKTIREAQLFPLMRPKQ